MIGWIKINREISNHWIFKDSVKFKWWIDILLIVNYEDKKTPIGFKLFECKRGESLMSLQNWASRWNVSKTVVNNFFRMLENDNMIKVINETVTTRLIVCNYDSYQFVENANKTQTKRNRNAIETQQSTTKELEEINNINIINNKNWRENFEFYLEDCKKGFREFLDKKENIEHVETYYPNVDLQLTLEKSFKEYWGTEKGWKKRKLSKTNELDWYSTIINLLKQKFNLVYIQK